LAVALLLLLVPVARLVSQGASIDSVSPVRWSLQVQFDNDFFALRDSGAPTDQDYTHGMGGLARWPAAPAALRRRLGDLPGCQRAEARRRGCLLGMLGVRQAIYTPASNLPAPIPGQRPHAGYLGVRAGVQYVTTARQRTVLVDVGTTGRPSLAAPLQGFIHNVTGSAPELGWRHQLGARPALAVSWRDDWQATVEAARLLARGRATYGGQLGTLRTAALVGAEIELALAGRLVWSPQDGAGPLPLGPFLIGQVRDEFVARDLFVDGHFRDRSVTSERVGRVWQTSVGFGWRFAQGLVEYRHVRRGREYAAQPAPHAYGAVSFTWHAF
jgi:hypothetical protein